MPEFFRAALEERGLMDAYRARPPYQQNDYIGWINRAKLEATKQKCLSKCSTNSKKAAFTCG